MMDMPIGHYWAYVEANQADQIVQRSGDVCALYGHYRGWAGLEGSLLQVAEREMWMQFGWDWFTFHKSGQILSQDADNGEEPEWAEIQIDYSSPNGGNSGAYIARVEVRERVSTIHTSGEEEEYPYPQYVVMNGAHEQSCAS
jgi:hypothetical protein